MTSLLLFAVCAPAHAASVHADLQALDDQKYVDPAGVEAQLEPLTAADRPETRSTALAILGDIYVVRNGLAEAERFYREALEISEDAGLGGVRARATMGLAIVAGQRGEDTQHVEGLTRAATIASRAGERALLARILTNLGRARLMMLDPVGAIAELERANTIIDSLPDEQQFSASVLSAFHIIYAAAFKDIGDDNGAQRELARAEELARDAGAVATLPDILHQRAEFLIENGNYAEAEPLVMEACEIGTENRIERVEAPCQINRAALAAAAGRYTDSIAYGLAAERILSDNDVSPQMRIYLHRTLADAFSNAGQPREAASHLATAIDLIEQSAADQVANIVASARRLEDARSALQSAEAAEAEAVQQSRLRTAYAVIAVLGGILLSVIGGALWFRLQNQRRSGEKLAERNAVISRALDEKEMLIGELDHRVRRNLQTVISMLKLQRNELPSADPRIDVLDDTSERLHLVGLIQQRLGSHRAGDTGRSDELLTMIGESTAALFDREEDLVLDLDDAELDSDEALIVGLSAFELLSNAFTHGAKGRVTLAFEVRDGEARLQVKEDESEVPMTEVKTGIGLGLIERLVANVGGSVSPGRGRYAIKLLRPCAG